MHVVLTGPGSSRTPMTLSTPNRKTGRVVGVKMSAGQTQRRKVLPTINRTSYPSQTRDTLGSLASDRALDGEGGQPRLLGG